jgi:pyruvate,water dikinase
VDAYTGRVYEGRVMSLLALQDPDESPLKDTPVYRTLQNVANWIVPLHLLDPKSPSFSPNACRSLHDIMRFAHEMSYAEMFRISDLVTDQGAGAVRMEAPLPLDLRVIDLGGGLTGVPARARRVSAEQVASVPFRAVLKGMMHHGLRSLEPRPVEFRGLLSVMTEQMFTNPHAADRFGDRSYALVSDKYLNFSSRVGYHYGVLDSYCGETVNKNYITFSFQGGAADDVRRNRRARAIASILDALCLLVEVKGDRVTARLQKCDRATVEEKLEMLGRLLIFTRQLDMLMTTEASVGTASRCFLEGNYQCDLS